MITLIADEYIKQVIVTYQDDKRKGTSLSSERMDDKGETMYWYILFVRANREKQTERFLSKTLGINKYMPFIPMSEIIYKKSGVIKKERKPLFPNYVFIETEVCEQEFITKISKLIGISRDIIRVLRYSYNEIALRETEKKMLLSLCNEDHCIESSSGFIAGERIQITEGPLKGRESIIKKINRHKREAWIEMEFMGNKRVVILPLEIVSKS